MTASARLVLSVAVGVAARVAAAAPSPPAQVVGVGGKTGAAYVPEPVVDTSELDDSWDEEPDIRTSDSLDQRYTAVIGGIGPGAFGQHSEYVAVAGGAEWSYRLVALHPVSWMSIEFYLGTGSFIIDWPDHPARAEAGMPITGFWPSMAVMATAFPGLSVCAGGSVGVCAQVLYPFALLVSDVGGFTWAWQTWAARLMFYTPGGFEIGGEMRQLRTADDRWGVWIASGVIAF